MAIDRHKMKVILKQGDNYELVWKNPPVGFFIEVWGNSEGPWGDMYLYLSTYQNGRGVMHWVESIFDKENISPERLCEEVRRGIGRFTYESYKGDSVEKKLFETKAIQTFNTLLSPRFKEDIDIFRNCGNSRINMEFFV